LTKELRQKISRDASQEKDPVIETHFFSPYMGWAWSPIAFDGHDIFYGLVKGFEEEIGTFSYKELVELEKNGLPIVERDKYWTPKKLSEVMSK
jgi:hypothetical protein